ncbi:MAG: glycogen synthase GlgA, partial [Candidatus Aureabacteria bacterium]|nr:glycogen synthase GlgA [Candidatus Auribacterota bacterium]
MKSDAAPLTIAIAASEIVPLAKTGGLADVTGGLARALAQRGHPVSLIHPLYDEVRENCRRRGIELHPAGDEFEVRIGAVAERGRIWSARIAPGVTAYCVSHRGLFSDRAGLYGDGGRDYPDNPERFVFFCESALAVLRGLGRRVQIFHCHDWQTGFIPAYLHFRAGEDGFFSRTASVFTIHNLFFQGLFPASRMPICNLPWGAYNPAGIEFYGQINPMKAGLIYSTLLTTVSAKYAREILTEELGCGLEGVVEARRKDLFPILSGADYGEWNPKNDRMLPARYGPADLSGKTKCREDLLRAVGLKAGPSTPVVGMVSRITAQKGFDLFLQAAPRLLEGSPVFVILGQGDVGLQTGLKELERAYPQRVRVILGFDEALAHRIIAGSDFSLLPSRFEPAGLTQIYSLRYGAIPIVRATGGLADTIIDYRHDDPDSNGFVFSEYTPDALLDTVKRAVDTYRDKAEWERLVRTALASDFSWRVSADKYVDFYRDALVA